MNLFTLVKSWKDFSFIWTVIQPFVFRLLKKNVGILFVNWDNFVSFNSEKSYSDKIRVKSSFKILFIVNPKLIFQKSVVAHELHTTP